MFGINSIRNDTGTDDKYLDQFEGESVGKDDRAGDEINQSGITSF